MWKLVLILGMAIVVVGMSIIILLWNKGGIWLGCIVALAGSFVMDKARRMRSVR